MFSLGDAASIISPKKIDFSLTQSSFEEELTFWGLPFGFISINPLLVGDCFSVLAIFESSVSSSLSNGFKKLDFGLDRSLATIGVVGAIAFIGVFLLDNGNVLDGVNLTDGVDAVELDGVGVGGDGAGSLNNFFLKRLDFFVSLWLFDVSKWSLIWYK